MEGDGDPVPACRVPADCKTRDSGRAGSGESRISIRKSKEPRTIIARHAVRVCDHPDCDRGVSDRGGSGICFTATQKAMVCS